MEYFLNLVIIFTSFLIFFIFKKSRSYVSKRGLVLLTLLVFLVFTKTVAVGDLSLIGFRLDNFSEELLPLLIFTFMGIVILFTMRFKEKKFKVVSWAVSLVILYLTFGVIQQIFFQSIFTHTLNGLLEDRTLTIIFSSVFYSSFHWGWDVKGIKFGLLTLFAGAVWSLLFLSGSNVIMLGLSHAVLASIYYFVVYEDNVLEERLFLKESKGLLKLIFQKHA